MAKIAYHNQPKWNTKTRTLFSKIVEIVDEYQDKGYRMTLRQLYYQLVSRDVIPNQQKGIV